MSQLSESLVEVSGDVGAIAQQARETAEALVSLAGKPLHVAHFLAAHGRCPRIGDPIPPWHYKGWLLPIIQMCHAHPRADVGNRWDYHFQCLEAGKIIDDPIPQIHFSSVRGDSDPGVKHFWQATEILERHHGSGWDAMLRFIDWLYFACGFGEMPNIDDETQEKLYRFWNIEHWLCRPADYFGYVYSERHSNGWNPGAFFPTPDEVVEMMTRMTMPDLSTATKSSKVLDPCVGTGRMILHASNYSLRLYGQDIDDKCVKATLINGAFYAPWLSFPFPESFFGEERRETVADDSPPLVVSDQPMQLQGIPSGMLFDLGVRHVEKPNPVRNQTTAKRQSKKRAESFESLFDLTES